MKEDWDVRGKEVAEKEAAVDQPGGPAGPRRTSDENPPSPLRTPQATTEYHPADTNALSAQFWSKTSPA